MHGEKWAGEGYTSTTEDWTETTIPIQTEVFYTHVTKSEGILAWSCSTGLMSDLIKEKRQVHYFEDNF